MREVLDQFVSQTPLVAWSLALIAFTFVEVAIGRAIAWRQRITNSVNGALVLLVIFFTGPGVAWCVVHAQLALGLAWNPPFYIEQYVPSAVFAAVIFLVLYDFGYYWFHRLQHRMTWLWRVHAVHHSDTAMNATTYVRQHVLENVFQSLVIMVPLLLVVRVSASALAWVVVVSVFFQFFAHLDLRWPIPFLDRVVITPAQHRIHHSVDPTESNSNFASLFPVWDICFGTFRAPRIGHTPATGLHDGRRLCGLLALLRAPFQK